MKKFCVFCGRHPSHKTREHVLPMWILRLTGDPTRPVFLGLDQSSPQLKPRVFPFSKFTFPSCKECNNLFSTLEELTKPIFTKLLTLKAVTNIEFSILMDWFDKVRLGLWLGHYILDKNPAGIQPKYHIVPRLSTHDRMLFISRLKDDVKGLAFFCASTPAFQITPSCFGLAVNNISFINISYHYLLARRLGFPYPSVMFETGKRQPTYFEMRPGLERILRPVVKKNFRIAGTELYQPMFKLSLQRPELKAFYQTKYVEARSIEWENGEGEVFIKKSDIVVPYKTLPASEWVPPSIQRAKTHRYQFVIDVLDWQVFINSLWPSPKRLSKNEKGEYHRLRANVNGFNNKFIKQIKAEKEVALERYPVF